jgi:hypothetical protein
MGMDSERDFFISYTRADKQWAEWIAWILEAEGYTTVLQAWDFHSGYNFVVKMDEATCLVQPYKAEGLLASIAYIDLVGLDRTEAKKALLKGLQWTRNPLKRNKPDRELDFPM